MFIADLDQGALIVATLALLTGTLQPALGRLLPKRDDLPFLHPWLAFGLTEVACLGAFLVVLHYRNALHHWPPFWVWFVFLLAAFLALYLIDLALRRSPVDLQSSSFLRAILLPVAANAALVLSMVFVAVALTQFSTQKLISSQIHGALQDPGGRPPRNARLTLTTGSDELTVTPNRSGRYQFLLTQKQAERASELHAMADGYACDKFVYLTREFPAKVDFECRSE